MSEHDQGWWEKARRARAQLEAVAMRHSSVQMVSIGRDPEQSSQSPVLIVYVRQGAAAPPGMPGEIEGIPVRVTFADFQLEQGDLT